MLDIFESTTPCSSYLDTANITKLEMNIMTRKHPSLRIAKNVTLFPKLDFLRIPFQSHNFKKLSLSKKVLGTFKGKDYYFDCSKCEKRIDINRSTLVFFEMDTNFL
jgi:hypothetical protein